MTDEQLKEQEQKDNETLNRIEEQRHMNGEFDW